MCGTTGDARFGNALAHGWHGQMLDWVLFVKERAVGGCL